MEEKLDASPRSKSEPEMSALGWQHLLPHSSMVQLTPTLLQCCPLSEAEGAQAECQLDHSRWGGAGGHWKSSGDSGFTLSALCKAEHGLFSWWLHLLGLVLHVRFSLQRQNNPGGALMLFQK